MTSNGDDILPNASDIMMRIAEAQADKAAAHDRQKSAEQAEKDALIKKLSQPSGRTEEEKVKLAATVIKRAMDNGLLEVQVYRFPNALCNRSWPRHQPGGARVGTNASRHSKGDLSALARSSP